ncbi:MAG: chemotaxis protein CheW [Deferribacteraceae bacterium]|jgi:two-component system chemotaxis sensor kinase CheA|nr:chemotaxis protein CheW [Deferribacteraceae bacterium]
MNKEEMQELVGDFIVETTEIIDTLDQDLVELEHRKNDLDLLNKIFRGAHTMKGSSSFLGFDKMSTVTHHAEEILNKLRKGEMGVSTTIMDYLLEFVDVVKKVLNDIKMGSDSADITAVVRKLKLANEGKIDMGGDKESSDAPTSAPQSGGDGGDVKKASKTMEQTIRVDVTRLDTLMNLVGELVLGRNRISQLSQALEKKFENEYLVEQLLETTSQIGLITTELQLAVMKTRMIPVGKTFNKFPRMVRDISRENGKEIELIISGEETELDKSVIEEIGDPLIHMIRNSVDHGVEMPDIREQLGKPRKGNVWLSAYHEGNHIVIEIRDDGKGLDAEMLKRKAIEKKVISAEEAAGLDKNACYALIFRPGFSTAATITNVSGRGVGMDVVKTNIEKLNGIINIESEINVGTRFQLKLPLTLAIIQALFVESAGENFAIPLVSVIETVRVNVKEVHSFEGREVLKLRDSVLSLLRLDEVFELESPHHDELYVVVVGLAEKRLGFIVDKLVGQEEIVIKSLGEYLGGKAGIAGATIMGDGRVRLIIDVAGVMDLAQNMPRRMRTRKKKESGSKKSDKNTVKIAYVDDSATDRKIMKRLLESTGWIEVKEIVSAKDVAAILASDEYPLLITDIMMPDMDGYELARLLRNKGLELPIIAVSSRSETADRKKVSASGINAFITKPVNLQVMLEKIDELLSQKAD